ncbi:fructosamine kinase family protein [Actinomadura flavalba]|uniref:fructosamine kinase family protein n=1 Tax=Actinomadura flavalba TaxID=1120938 RepID=UPI00037B13AB|nr:fructosamine kinase family protein [Actinomadura flavalba]
MSALHDVTDLGSSHSWTLHRARLDDGTDVFVKRAASAPGVFDAEARGLRWLVEAGGDPPVARVVHADERTLVLPWLPTRSPDARAAERFGRELAALHAAGPEEFGASWDGFIADLPLDNTPDPGPWPRWFAERRLAPYLPAAARHLTTADVRRVERVLESIDALAGPPEPPSRTHGDLWSGNVLWSDGRGILIDPAAHGGHRETDLAALDLFGAPHLDRVLAAYDETVPLADGWRERVPLHQMHLLLVHVVLFGSSYAPRLADAAARSLASGG